MAQPRIVRCLRFGSIHSSRRAFHTSTRRAAAPLSVADLLDTAPSTTDNVIVNGFIRSIRNQKNRSFASIGDGSSLEPLQALLTPQQAQRYVPLPISRRLADLSAVCRLAPLSD